MESQLCLLLCDHLSISIPSHFNVNGENSWKQAVVIRKSFIKKEQAEVAFRKKRFRKYTHMIA